MLFTQILLCIVIIQLFSNKKAIEKMDSEIRSNRFTAEDRKLLEDVKYQARQAKIWATE